MYKKFHDDDEGILDWEQKIEAAYKLTGTRSAASLARAVEAHMERKLDSDYGDLINRWKKGPPRGDGHEFFFKGMNRIFGLPADTPNYFLVEEPYISVWAAMPAQNQGVVPLPAQQEFIHTFHVDLAVNDENFSDWLRNRLVDQRNMYIGRDCVANYHRAANDKGYKNLNMCQVLLGDFVESDPWVELISNNKVGSVVILGAGSAEKDDIVLSSIDKITRNERKRLINYAIIDASYDMLFDTYKHIQEIFQTKDRPANVQIQPFHADFTDLYPLKWKIQPQDGSATVFMCLGGTIGNINENNFLTSIRACSKEGDYLLLAAEFIDGISPRDIETRLKEEYGGDGMKDLALGPIRGELDRQGVSPVKEDRRKKVVVNVGPPERFDDFIEGTIAAKLQIAISGTMLTLLESKRYRLEKFKAFFRGFDFVGAYERNDNPRFKHLLFRRTTPALE
ncbi:hypothetical protein ABAC460_11135 [Asticcacaulis sp. AC460]|uniref:L-histidine N(alpha)-methyltransferase n=1 Tax=Asticcacaulis sp. AC460 TaxID=1282360 RepID=UPI0003C405CA|nr:L-histidine N(alpha)-methyltransferase [Asticcacaulis sp. AC460]ESQ89849.1 hypothetical protein ABAC460_11135 [Asticcacaulis sp. AC460]